MTWNRPESQVFIFSPPSSPKKAEAGSSVSLHRFVLLIVISHTSGGEVARLQPGSFRLSLNMNLEPFLELSGLGTLVQLHCDVRIAFLIFSSEWCGLNARVVSHIWQVLGNTLIDGLKEGDNLGTRAFTCHTTRWAAQISQICRWSFLPLTSTIPQAAESAFALESCPGQSLAWNCYWLPTCNSSQKQLWKGIATLPIACNAIHPRRQTSTSWNRHSTLPSPLGREASKAFILSNTSMRNSDSRKSEFSQQERMLG